MINIHASCISFNNKGILLLGKSGAGKSDLALRLIEQINAILVADDRINLEVKYNEITGYCPDNIKGLLEVRGVGIIRKEYQPEIKIKLVVELTHNMNEIARMPEKEYWEFEQVKIRKIKLYPFENSAVYKIKAACDEIGEVC